MKLIQNNNYKWYPFLIQNDHLYVQPSDAKVNGLVIEFHAP